MNTDLLSVEGLMVFYENALAVNNISLAAKEGAITGIFGMNSAGKSTLCYTIAGIMLDMQRRAALRDGERITILGNIGFDGADITTLPAWERARRGIVLCPERRRLFVESSVLENLKIGAYLANRREWTDSLSYVFDLFPPLVRLKRRAAGFLSGGEQQMVAIARALLSQPRMLLLDEPFLGLSIGMQDVLIEAIKKIGEERGITIVIAEQYARPLFPVIDYGYIIENGSVVIEGTSEELLANPDVRSAYWGI